jgi:hypothetical protein
MRSTRSGIWLLSLLAAATWPMTSPGEQTMKTEELTRMKEEVIQRLQRHYVQHKGAQEPHSIPFPARMRSFFSAATRSADDRGSLAKWLDARMPLSESDNRALVEAIAAARFEPANIAPVYADSRALKQQLTETEDAATGIEIGRKLNSLQDDADALYTAHFERILSGVSSQGRRSLDEYVYREIVPRMSYTRVDHAGLYADMAALLPQIKELQAHGLLTVQHRDQRQESEHHGSAGAFVGVSKTE